MRTTSFARETIAALIHNIADQVTESDLTWERVGDLGKAITKLAKAAALID